MFARRHLPDSPQVNPEVVVPPQDTARPAPILGSKWWSENAVILSAGVGMGHHRAAQALADALGDPLLRETPPILDVLEFMSPIPRRIYRDGYLALTRQAPTSLGKLYEMSDSVNSLDGPALLLDRALGRRLERHLERLEPTVILSTHFLTSRIAGALKNEGRIHSRLLQVVTDFDAHAYWAVGAADRICVAGEPARSRLISLGVAAERILLTGIPVADAFRNPPEKTSARQTLGLPHNKPVVLLTLGGLGSSPYGPLVEGLLRGKREPQIVVVCGRNAAAHREVQQIVAKLPPRQADRFHIVGFTTGMATYMAAADLLIGKPGGLTSSEALACGLPMILVNPIPGQEERNADYLLEQGVAVRCRYPEQLGQRVDDMMGKSGELLRRTDAARRLGRRNAVSAILHEAKGLALDSILDRHQSQRISLDHLIADICSPSQSPGDMVFDLDHTLLTGDIGDAVFIELHERGLLLNLPILGRSGETLCEVRENESPLERYQRALHLAAEAPYPGEILAPTYAWMSASLGDLSIEDIHHATRNVWQDGEIDVREEVLQVIAAGLTAGHHAVIVSATNQAVVSWVIEEVVNPRLTRTKEGAFIFPRDVWGMNNYTDDGADVREAILNGRATGVWLTTQIRFPHSCFIGKADLLRSAGYDNIILVAGDSPNDFEMMRLADRALWINRIDSPRNGLAFKAELETRAMLKFTALTR